MSEGKGGLYRMGEIDLDALTWADKDRERLDIVLEAFIPVDDADFALEAQGRGFHRLVLTDLGDGTWVLDMDGWNTERGVVMPAHIGRELGRLLDTREETQ